MQLHDTEDEYATPSRFLFLFRNKKASGRKMSSASGLQVYDVGRRVGICAPWTGFILAFKHERELLVV